MLVWSYDWLTVHVRSVRGNVDKRGVSFILSNIHLWFCLMFYTSNVINASYVIISLVDFIHFHLSVNWLDNNLQCTWQHMCTSVGVRFQRLSYTFYVETSIVLCIDVVFFLAKSLQSPIAQCLLYNVHWAGAVCKSKMWHKSLISQLGQIAQMLDDKEANCLLFNSPVMASPVLLLIQLVLIAHNCPFAAQLLAQLHTACIPADIFSQF